MAYRESGGANIKFDCNSNSIDISAHLVCPIDYYRQVTASGGRDRGALVAPFLFWC